MISRRSMLKLFWLAPVAAPTIAAELSRPAAVEMQIFPPLREEWFASLQPAMWSEDVPSYRFEISGLPVSNPLEAIGARMDNLSARFTPYHPELTATLI